MRLLSVSACRIWIPSLHAEYWAHAFMFTMWKEPQMQNNLLALVAHCCLLFWFWPWTIVCWIFPVYPRRIAVSRPHHAVSTLSKFAENFFARTRSRPIFSENQCRPGRRTRPEGRLQTWKIRHLTRWTFTSNFLWPHLGTSWLEIAWFWMRSWGSWGQGFATTVSREYHWNPCGEFLAAEKTDFPFLPRPKIDQASCQEP